MNIIVKMGQNKEKIKDYLDVMNALKDVIEKLGTNINVGA